MPATMALMLRRHLVSNQYLQQIWLISRREHDVLPLLYRWLSRPWVGLHGLCDWKEGKKPLLDIDGFPVSLSYHAGIPMDMESSFHG